MEQEHTESFATAYGGTETGKRLATGKDGAWQKKRVVVERGETGTNREAYHCERVDMNKQNLNDNGETSSELF